MHRLLLPLLTFLLLLNGLAAEPGKEQKAEKTGKPADLERVGGIPLNDIQILGIWAVDRSASVLLTDSAGKNLIYLGFQPDANGSKLISASLEPGGEMMKVVALLDGKERTLVRPIAKMPLVDSKAGHPIMNRPGVDSKKEKGTHAKSADSDTGPSEEDRKNYESLSSAGREKFRAHMRQMFADETFRKSSEEARRAAVRAMFDKVAREDKER